MVANPYVQGWREWDERYADLAIGRRNWQIAAGGLLVLSLILAGGLVWLASRSRYLPYIVEVDKLGYALTQAQPLTAASAPDVVERIERYEVAHQMTSNGLNRPPTIEIRPGYQFNVMVTEDLAFSGPYRG